jgi:hypothetical protein
MTQTFIYQTLIDKLSKDEPCTSRELKSALVDLEVKFATEKYISGQLREGLAFYKPGPFWTEVLKDTKAAEDQGKHAEWILRLTDPNAA